MDKVYYHGSNNKFTKFDKSKIRKNKLGLCFNFTDDYSMAYQYGDNILKVHLDLNNPLTKEVFNTKWTYEQDNMLAKKLGFPDINKEDFDDTETFGDVYEIFKMDSRFIELLEEMGYDGIAFPEDHHYGVFEPEQIHVIGDEMKESLEKLGEKLYPTYFTKSAYDIANLIKNKPEPYRILFDKTYGYWLIGNGNVLTHIDLLDEAGDAALYYNEKDFDGHEYYENNLANNGGENNLCRLVFMPRYAYDGPGAGYTSDGYNLKYYIETGVIYANNLYPLEDTELGKLLNIEDVEDIEDMDESLNERFEEIERNVYATNSGYDIINRMKNKPNAYRIIYDKNINYYFIGDAFDYIHQDMLEHAYYNGFYPDMLSANECDDYMNQGMEEQSIILFAFDPDGGGMLDQEKSSDGYTRKYVYDFGTIYSHEFTPFEKCPLYELLGEPIKKEFIYEALIKTKANIMENLVSKLNKVMKPKNNQYWKEIIEDMGALGAAPCPALGQSGTASGCTVNGIPVAGKSVGVKKKKKSKKNEQIEVKHEGILEVPEDKNVEDLPIKHFQKLIDKKGYEPIIKALTNLEVWNKKKNKSLSSWAKNMIEKLKSKNEALLHVANADAEIQLGDTYFAETEQDVFNSLDKMTLGDATGAWLRHKEYDEIQELTIELIDEDQYILKIEEDTPENMDDWEGKNVLDTEPMTKEEVIFNLKSLFQDYNVVKTKELEYENTYNEHIENIISELLNEDFNEAYERITDLIAKQLDKMNFEFANTDEIIYKKEGEYKYLFKFDNELGIIKIKVVKGEEVLVEREWTLDEEDDVSPIFEEIENIYGEYGL